MNRLLNILKLNHHPATICIAGSINLGLLYYTYNVEGIYDYPMIVEVCTDNSHIITGGPMLRKEQPGVIIPIFCTMLFGGLSSIFYISVFYGKRQHNINILKNKYDDTGCFCGQIKSK